MVGVTVKITHCEDFMHKFGGNLDNVPPILSHLYAIPQDEFLLVLCLFCFEAIDDPIKALHYDFELDRFSARDNFPGLV